MIRNALPESPSHFAEQNDSPLSKGAFCNLYSSAINALPAGAAVVYTPPKCEAGQTEGSGGRGAGGGRLVKSPPPAAVFFPRFLLGIQKKSGRRRQWQYDLKRTARIPRHFAMQNDCPLYKGAICGLLHTLASLSEGGGFCEAKD